MKTSQRKASYILKALQLLDCHALGARSDEHLVTCHCEKQSDEAIHDLDFYNT